MCRPGHGSSREASAGGHIGPPLRDMGWCSGTNGAWRRTGPPPPGRDGARPLRGTGGVRGGVRLGCGFRQPNFGTKFGASVMGIGPYAPRGDEGRHAGSSCPTGGCGEPPRLPWVAAHSGASAAQTGGTGGNRGRDHPKSVQQRRTIPQSAFGRQLPLHKGALGAGGTDCHVGPAGLLAMTMVFCHSEERADVGIRPFYDGREFGPPRSSAPTENPINHPSQPARSEASAPAAARDGRESTQGPSQKGDRPRNRPGSA